MITNETLQSFKNLAKDLPNPTLKEAEDIIKEYVDEFALTGNPNNVSEMAMSNLTILAIKDCFHNYKDKDFGVKEIQESIKNLVFESIYGDLENAGLVEEVLIDGERKYQFSKNGFDLANSLFFKINKDENKAQD